MYCTFDDLKDALSLNTLLQLCDDEGVGAFVQQPPNTAYQNLTAAISRADAEINSRIVGRYAVPVTLAPVPRVLVDLSVDLSVCNLFDRRREMDVPEGIERRRKAAIKLLADIKNGVADIPELTTYRPATILCSKQAGDRMFTDDVLNKY